MTTVTATAPRIETTTLLGTTAAAPRIETTMLLGTTTLFPANVTTTRHSVKDLDSIFKASKPMLQETTTTTTTTESSQEDDIYWKKTQIVHEKAVLHTKIIIIVVMCVIVGLGCVLVAFAYLRFLKKKTRVVLPPILYRPNEPVVIPEFRQTPVMSHRNRMTDLGRFFAPFNSSQNLTHLQQQQLKPSFEIEIEDIKFFVPDFEPFPGFDLVRFRHLASGVRNTRLLTEPGYKLECDPLRVFHFFPDQESFD
jgi:hypothetical protein